MRIYGMNKSTQKESGEGNAPRKALSSMKSIEIEELAADLGIKVSRCGVRWWLNGQYSKLSEIRNAIRAAIAKVEGGKQ